MRRLSRIKSLRWSRRAVSYEHTHLAASSHDPAESNALLDATLSPNSMPRHEEGKALLQNMALSRGSPEMLQRLRQFYGVDKAPTNDMLIQAVEERETGGIPMLEWLLGFGLDINYINDLPSLLERHGNARDAGEAEMILDHLGVSERQTSLHATVHKGNAEAIRYLLARGADPNLKDGKGQTARDIARKKAHRIIQILDDDERQRL